MSTPKEVKPSKGAAEQMNRGDQSQLEFQNQNQPSQSEAKAKSANNSEHATVSTKDGNAAAGDEEKLFDPSEGQVVLQSAARIKVRPDHLRGNDGTNVFLPARMSGIPWTVLECLYRAFWVVLSAALGVSRDSIKYASGERIAGTYLYSAAAYQVTPDDVLRLGEADVRSRIEVGIALLSERYLWVSTELASRYIDLPWQEMLPACQQARDEIKAKKLPCQVGIEIKGTNPSLVVGPELAPRRPAKVDKRIVNEVGHSNGYLHRRNHKLHFSKDDARNPEDISYDELTFLDLVISVSDANPPWIHVTYEEEKHDGIVVSRVMVDLKKKSDSLFGDEPTD